MKNENEQASKKKDELLDKMKNKFYEEEKSTQDNIVNEYLDMKTIKGVVIPIELLKTTESMETIRLLTKANYWENMVKD